MSERGQDDIIERPSWYYPAIVAGLTVVAGGLILLWLLWPALSRSVGLGGGPVASAATKQVSAGGVVLTVPENLLAPGTPSAGRVQLLALLPDLTGYTQDDAGAFADYGPDSRVVRITLAGGGPGLSEQERFERILIRQAGPEASAEGDFTVYRFAEGSGYEGRRLFVFDRDGVFAAIVCADDAAAGAADNCVRTIDPAYGLEIAYEFRIGRLSEWREIDAAVRALAARVTAPEGGG